MTTRCITLDVVLHTPLAQLIATLEFRVVQVLQHDFIICYESFRKLDLSQVFRHLFSPIETSSHMNDSVQGLAKLGDASSKRRTPLSSKLTQHPPEPVIAGNGALHACECALHSRRVIFPKESASLEYQVNLSTAVYKHPPPTLQTGGGQSSDNLNYAFLGALSEERRA